MFISAVRTSSRRQPPCSQIEFLARLHSAKKRVHSWLSSQSHKGAAFLGGYLALGAFLVIVSLFPLLHRHQPVQCNAVCLQALEKRSICLFLSLADRHTSLSNSYWAALERNSYFLSVCPAHELKPTSFSHLHTHSLRAHEVLLSFIV